jgi:hypothetical protein
MMTVDRTRRVWVGAIWLLAMTGAVALVVAALYGASGPDAGSALLFAALAVAVAAYAGVGAVLLLRRKGERVGALLLAAAVMIGLTFLGYFGGAILAIASGTHDVLAGLLALVGAVCLLPTLILAGPALALVFPDGYLPGPRWRWPVLGLVVIALVSSALVLVRPGPIGDDLALNPVGISSADWLAGLSDLGFVLGLPGVLFLAVAAVVVRFRRSRDAEREQLKWFVGANVMVATFLVLAFTDGAGSTSVFDVLGVASLSLPPIAIGAAILRYRLYDIDRIISRTIGYLIVTGVLAVIFVGAILVFTALLSPVFGENPVAVAASTLIVAALFQPLRVRVQRAVDRRFNRARYDAERTVTAFSARLRDDVDLASLDADLGRVVQQTLAPASQGLWLHRKEMIE